MRLRIAARKSDLARLQALSVGKALRDQFPKIEIEYLFKSSLGDINLHDPLWKMPEKGVFTEDFKADLTSGACDLVVHSWKDLPVVDHPQTEIIGTLQREDVRDLILFKKNVARNQPGALKILSSSPRRAYNLSPFFREFLPWAVRDVHFEPLRGNMATRIEKFLANEADAMVLAKAALDRLLLADDVEFENSQKSFQRALQECLWMVAPISVNPPAAAQGALAIEALKSRDDLKSLVAQINAKADFECVRNEREVLRSYGGGCHQKIGVVHLAKNFGRVEFLKGLTDSGVVLDSIRQVAQQPQMKASEHEIYPQDPMRDQLFIREKLSPPENSFNLSEGFFVARDLAWPEGFRPQPEQIVWTAGLKTWKSLAQRGIWINGSQEGLGESEPLRLAAIMKSLGVRGDWVKFSHEDTSESESKRLVATYRLIPKPEVKVEWAKKRYFFWMSGTAFRRALELDPSLKSRGEHACGPGHTFDFLRGQLEEGASLKVFLDYEDWRRQFVTTNS